VFDRRTVASLFLAAALALALAGCPGRGIRIGVVLPLTGHAAVYGTAIQRGVELAHEESGKSLDGKPVELVTVDSGSDPERAKKELREIYKDGALVAIGGVTSAEALAMVDVADEEGRTLLSPSASLPKLTGISENFYRIFPSDFAEGTVMARYAYDDLRLRNGVILAKEETYAKGIQKIFADEFQRKGGKIVETIEFPPNTAEFAALADRATMLKPDFVYVAAYAQEASRAIRDLRANQFTGLILTTSSFAAAETIAETGAAAEQAYFTQTSFDTEGDISPQQAAFVKAFKARYGTLPDLYAAHGYDALNVIYEAYRQGGTSALSFWKGLRGVREMAGVTGTLQFDEKGDVQKFPHVYVIRNGKALDIEKERQEQIHKAREEMKRLQQELDRLRQGGS
jgi:branched-chain amino acid transport system substrate-binding protein